MARRVAVEGKETKRDELGIAEQKCFLPLPRSAEYTTLLEQGVRTLNFPSPIRGNGSKLSGLWLTQPDLLASEAIAALGGREFPSSLTCPSRESTCYSLT